MKTQPARAAGVLGGRQEGEEACTAFGRMASSKLVVHEHVLVHEDVLVHVHEHVHVQQCSAGFVKSVHATRFKAN